jgi:hypothetical protein
MTTNIGKSDPIIVLRVKLIEVMYVPRIWRWCSILRSQEDASRATDLGHPEGTFPVEGEFICAFTGEYASEHQVAHLELPAMHESSTIALEHLTVLCISDSCLPSSLIDEVDVHHHGEIGTQRTTHPLPSAPNVEVVNDTSTGTATRATRCGSLLEGLSLSYAQA